MTNRLQALPSVSILKPALFKQFWPKYLSMIADDQGYSFTTSPVNLYSNERFSAGYCISSNYFLTIFEPHLGHFVK
jgi:hypothetical protein